MRRFCRITSRRLLGAVRGSGRSLSILDAINSAFVGLFRNQIETEVLADDTSKKASHRMLLPFRRSHNGGDRCASGRPQHRDDAGVLGVGSRCRFDDAGADRVRDLFFLAFGAADRVAALDFDLGLVMGSLRFARRHPPHHLSPARQNSLQGKTPKPPQPLQAVTATLRSSRKPVNSEQDCCSIAVIAHVRVQILLRQPGSPTLGDSTRNSLRNACHWRAFAI